MKYFYNQAIKHWLILSIIWLTVVNCICTTLVASLTNIEWRLLSGTAKFVLVCVVAANVSGSLLPLCMNFLKKVESGKPLIPTDDTQFLSKPQTETPKQ